VDTDEVLRIAPAFGFLALLALAAGCESPATQLVVLVDTDFAVPDEVAGLQVTVQDAEGSEVSSAELAISDALSDSEAVFSLPLSFAVVPVDDDASRRVRVQVDGLDRDGAWVASRSVRTGFIEDETLLLPIFLLRSCESVMCPEGTTCGADGCESEEVDPEDLEDVRPGEELEVDSGLVDAGPEDAGEADSGPEDAGGPDAGDASTPPDAGPMDGSMDAGPIVLLRDGFEDGDIDGWTVSGPGDPWTARDVDSHTGAWSMRVQATGAGSPALVEHPVGGSCSRDLRLFYWRRLEGLDGADDFAARYRAAGSWVDVERLGGDRADDGAFEHRTFVVPSSSTHVGFLCEGGATSESCAVDDVRLVCE